MKAKKKRVDFSVRPRTAKEPLPPTSDQWVKEGKDASSQPQKRLTLNLPTGLHTTFKSRCVIEGVTIQDKVQQLIEREVASDRQPSGGEGAL
jgi:ParG